MRKVTAIRPGSELSRDEGMAVTGRLILAHDGRHLRRKAVELTDGNRIFFDLPEPVVLKSGDALILEDGALVLIEAMDEALYAITASSDKALSELAWHIGNRHLPAEISPERILILRDHVIKTMLEGLGAQVTEILAPFNPLRGAYSGHASHDHHRHDHSHDHSRGDGPGHPHSHADSHSHSQEHEHEHEHEQSR